CRDPITAEINAQTVVCVNRVAKNRIVNVISAFIDANAVTSIYKSVAVDDVAFTRARAANEVVVSVDDLDSGVRIGKSGHTVGLGAYHVPLNFVSVRRQYDSALEIA